MGVIYRHTLVVHGKRSKLYHSLHRIQDKGGQHTRAIAEEDLILCERFS